MAAAKKESANDAGFESVMSFGQDAFKQSYEKFTENASTVADFNKGALKATTESAAAWSKGMEGLVGAHSEFLKNSYERGVAASKSATGSKSLQEAFDIQAEFARESVDANLAYARKFSDMWADASKTTLSPLTECYGDLIEQIQAFRP